MSETREITLTVRLPIDVADQAEEVQRADPEFLSRVVLYGSSKATRVPKRTRAKIKRRFKRHFRLNRRQLGAIGAGHREAPPGYTAALAGALELARFRRLV